MLVNPTGHNPRTGVPPRRPPAVKLALAARSQASRAVVGVPTPHQAVRAAPARRSAPRASARKVNVRHDGSFPSWPGPGQFALRRDHLICLRARGYAGSLPERKGYGSDVELLSTVEIAELLGVTRQRVDQLYRSGDLPEPAAELAIGRVWARDDIIEWATQTGRLPSGSET
jgi:predicted DNA-binding transcriptional regulator AlpA